MQWEEKRLCHVQLEILVKMTNSLAKYPICLGLCGATVAAVAANVMIVKLHEIQIHDRPLLITYVTLFAVTAFASGAGYAVLALVGGLRCASASLLDEIELEIMREARVLCRNAAHVRKIGSLRYIARRYRRQTVAIRLGTFMYAEPGMEADFLRSIFDNTVNWLFMVSLESPMWALY